MDAWRGIADKLLSDVAAEKMERQFPRVTRSGLIGVRIHLTDRLSLAQRPVIAGAK